MRFGLTLTAALCCLTLASIAGATTVEQSGIEGNYVEVRSCDVFTGHCFANGEMGLMGREAILSWDITKGGWEGTALDGLKVVAVVRANGTLGLSTGSQYAAKSVLIVDSKASAAQKTALVKFAKSMTGSLLDDVVEVQESDIEMSFGQCSAKRGASVKAGKLVNVEARPIVDADLVCRAEKDFYPPLAKVDNPVAHFTERDKFDGTGLGIHWDESGGRTAYVATFQH